MELANLLGSRLPSGSFRCAFASLHSVLTRKFCKPGGFSARRQKDQSDRKEVVQMIKNVTSIDTVIEDVNEIMIYPVVTLEKGFSRLIFVRTENNENYYLKLQSDYKHMIEVILDAEKPETEWLAPKVYKGKSMAEFGEDKGE